MQISKRGFLIGVPALLMTDAAVAHHSFAMFDAGRRLTLVGTVKEFQWRNPHIQLRLLVDAEGHEVEWLVEGANPSSLSRRGWSRASVKAGDHARVVVHPMRDGTPIGVLVSLTVNGALVGPRS